MNWNGIPEAERAGRYCILSIIALSSDDSDEDRVVGAHSSSSPLSAAEG